MLVTAIKTFRSGRAGTVIAGETLNVSDVYGAELVRTGLVKRSKPVEMAGQKLAPEHENKMLGSAPENKSGNTKSK